jgi:hypothetical protein
MLVAVTQLKKIIPTITTSLRILKMCSLWLPWKFAAQVTLQERTCCMKCHSLMTSRCHTPEIHTQYWS